MRRKVAVALALGATSCASIVQGPVQRVRFDSQPPGATVRADMQSCTTPCSLPLRRNRNVDAVVELDGYATESVPVRYELDPWIVGNLAFLMFAPIGGAIDIVSGAGFQLYPADVKVPLRPVAGPASAPAAPGRPGPAQPLVPGAKPRAPEGSGGEWKELPPPSRDL